MWCAESNRPAHIVEDWEFNVLMKAGRPSSFIPSTRTVTRDIKSAFERCHNRIDKILKVSVDRRFQLLTDNFN